MLAEQQCRYPDLVIEPLSSEALWELVRGLSLQQRAEILGAPSGYEHLFLLPNALPAEIERLGRRGRFVLVHDVLSPVNIRDAVDALRPEKPFGPPFYVRPPYSDSAWELSARYQATIVEDALQRSRDLIPRFAVFSLAPIPLAIHLGYLFSDRAEVRLFQYDRDRKTWRWERVGTSHEINFPISGFPDTPLADSADAIIRVSLSAEIAVGDTVAAAGDYPVAIDLRVNKPDVMWLRDPRQLVVLSQSFRGVLRDLCRLMPNCKRIHLFYAGLTGGAIAIGQAINPRMTPEVALYEYNRRRTPRYEHVLTLG